MEVWIRLRQVVVVTLAIGSSVLSGVQAQEVGEVRISELDELQKNILDCAQKPQFLLHYPGIYAQFWRMSLGDALKCQMGIKSEGGSLEWMTKGWIADMIFQCIGCESSSAQERFVAFLKHPRSIERITLCPDHEWILAEQALPLNQLGTLLAEQYVKCILSFDAYSRRYRKICGVTVQAAKEFFDKVMWALTEFALQRWAACKLTQEQWNLLFQRQYQTITKALSFLQKELEHRGSQAMDDMLKAATQCDVLSDDEDLVEMPGRSGCGCCCKSSSAHGDEECGEGSAD